MTWRTTLALAAALAGPAIASGAMPPLPLPEENLGSYEVCLTNLKNISTLDVTRFGKPPETRADGSVLSHSLISDGVVETGAETAIYKAEYGTTVSVKDAASGQMKHQYSWERVDMMCTGGMLTGTTSQGFSSPVFEPAP